MVTGTTQRESSQYFVAETGNDDETYRDASGGSASGRPLGSPRLCGRSPVSTEPFCADGLALWALCEPGTDRQRLPGCPLGTLSFPPRPPDRCSFELREESEDEVEGSRPESLWEEGGGGLGETPAGRQLRKASPEHFGFQPAAVTSSLHRSPPGFPPPFVTSVYVLFYCGLLLLRTPHPFPLGVLVFPDPKLFRLETISWNGEVGGLVWGSRGLCVGSTPADE